MHLFAQIAAALEPAKPACAWLVWAGYDAKYGTSDEVEGPMEHAQATARQSELWGLMPGRPVKVLFDPMSLG